MRVTDNRKQVYPSILRPNHKAMSDLPTSVVSQNVITSIPRYQGIE